MKFRYEYANCPCCGEQLSYDSEEDGVVSFSCRTDECPVQGVTIRVNNNDSHVVER